MAVEFDYQPTLQSERFELRPLRAADFDGLYAVAADPLVWEQHFAKDRHLPEPFRASFDEALASGRTLVAIDRSERRIVGSSRFHGRADVPDEVEIGWTYLARSHWGGPANRELKHAMLRHAFKFVSRVIFLVAPDNARSLRAMEKLGATRVDQRDEPGRGQRVVFAVTANEFRRWSS